MKLSETLDAKFKLLLEADDIDDVEDIEDEDSVEEISTTAGAGAYNTPKAFGKAKKKDIESAGYKQVKKLKEKTALRKDDETSPMTMYKRMMAELYDIDSKSIIKEYAGVFSVDDLVYNKRTKTIGIVRLADDKSGEVKTDADGNVNVDELEKFNPIKFNHQSKAKAAPSTKKEIIKRGLFNPFKSESVVNEARYKDYKSDESTSSKQKVNIAIKEINLKLFEIEHTINQNLKLKKEDGVGKDGYWKPTRSNLKKISEKMYRISEKLRKF